MNSFLFIVLSVTSTLSFAKSNLSGALEYKVSQANFATEHVSNPGQATLKLDYSQKKINLFVERRFHCPEGRACAMVMPAPLIVELPIVSVKTDRCGIRTVVAKKDSRPADGSLEVITVIDPNRMTCKTFVAVAHEATYTTFYFDRFKSQNVTNESKMTLVLKEVKHLGVEGAVFETSMAPSILIKYVQNSGFTPRPSIRTLFIDVTGRVIENVKDISSQKSTSTEVAQLSVDALKNLNKKIATIPADAKLIDENDGEPRCTDAPGSTLFVSVDHQDVAIYQFEGCHKHTVQTGEAKQLFDIIMAFIILAN